MTNYAPFLYWSFEHECASGLPSTFLATTSQRLCTQCLPVGICILLYAHKLPFFVCAFRFRFFLLSLALVTSACSLISLTVFTGVGATEPLYILAGSSTFALGEGTFLHPFSSSRLIFIFICSLFSPVRVALVLSDKHDRRK